MPNHLNPLLIVAAQQRPHKDTEIPMHAFCFSETLKQRDYSVKLLATSPSSTSHLFSICSKTCAKRTSVHTATCFITN